MSYSAEQDTIIQRFKSKWVDDLDEELTPVSWPNASYPPQGAMENDPEKYKSKPYAAIRVNRQNAFNVAWTAKDKLVRHPGIVTIDIRVPIGEGDARALELADVAKLVFANRTINGITFRASTVRDVGPRGSWYLVQVDSPFHRDEIMTHTEE